MAIEASAGAGGCCLPLIALSCGSTVLNAIARAANAIGFAHIAIAFCHAAMSTCCFCRPAIAVACLGTDHDVVCYALYFVRRTGCTVAVVTAMDAGHDLDGTAVGLRGCRALITVFPHAILPVVGYPTKTFTVGIACSVATTIFASDLLYSSAILLGGEGAFV